ncbi:MAG: ribonuclease III family protein, partial [Oligoflexia bacterium]|nr:ribonuclease III family protein [Oligoflexia bacterium]
MFIYRNPFFVCVLLCLIHFYIIGEECSDGFKRNKESIFIYIPSDVPQNVPDGLLERSLGYSFKNQKLKTDALHYFTATNKDQIREHGKHYFHSRRLEFLGDAVFNFYAFDTLVSQYPPGRYIELMKGWNHLKANRAMVALAFSLKLDQYAGKDVSSNRKSILLAKVLEALVGAVYLDGGYREAKKLVVRLVNVAIDTGIINGVEYTDLNRSSMHFAEWKKIEQLQFPIKYFYRNKVQVVGLAGLILLITEIVMEQY